MAGVWVFAEDDKLLFELLAAGRTLADQLDSPLSAIVCADDEAVAAPYFARGADEVLLLPPLAPKQALDGYVPVLAAAAQQQEPTLFLLPATARGRELAARIAGRLDAGLCSQCTALQVTGAGQPVRMERLAYGGAAVQSLTCTSVPAMATIPPGTFAPAPAQDGRSGRTRQLPEPAASPLQLHESKVSAPQTGNLGEARIVVGAGRGIEVEDDLALIGELAETFGGQVGCTRPLSEELHWLPDELCIGLSGVEVQPDLYFGVGVSGQIQHLTGVRGAKVIAAVDKDENAPIFGAADLGIVGDLYQVLPLLIAELKQQA